MKKNRYATFTILFAWLLLTSCGLFDSDPTTYNLTTTASPKEGGTITPSEGEFEEGEQITLRAEPNEEWLFVRWEGDINLSANPFYHRMNDHLNVIGIFEERSYPLNITIEGEGTIREEVVQQKMADYKYGTLVRLTAEPADGWRFVKWSGDAEGEDGSVEIVVDEEKSVTARFAKVPVSLSLKVSPEGSGSVGGSGEYEQGDVVSITAIPIPGYIFVNWTGDTGSISNDNAASTTVTMPVNNITLVANFEYIGNHTEVVEVTNPETGRIWMDRNLGASRAATSSTDEQAYGDLYQWGRAADGHQKRNSSTTSTRSSSNQPGHGSFILTGASPWDWRSPQNENLWQGVNGINNPCPVGYRLPTEAEWKAERDSWSSNNTAGALNSTLKLPVAGGRIYSSGSLFGVGTYGRYWSGTVSGFFARFMFFDSDDGLMGNYGRAYGGSVRCIKDE